MAEVVLEIRNITKKFPGVIANDNVDLTLYVGEVHALLGENGAGKSTLMNVLTGIYAPDAGTIHHKGKLVKMDSPKVAVDLGIGMVHQHFKLIEPLSVAENIYLASDECPRRLNHKAMNQRVRESSESYNLPVNPEAKIWQLSVGEQQRVEIVKLLFGGAEVLILDEPTAVLTPQESVALFSNLRALAKSGKSVLYITHKMFEVMEYADRISIMRGGKSVHTCLRNECSQSELTRIMMGHELEDVNRADYEFIEAVDVAPVLVLENVNAQSDKGLPALKNVSLEVHQGEILGIAGVSGNGQFELCGVISGIRKVEEGGRIYCDGKDITNFSAYEVMREGISYIPEDRMGTGLAAGLNMLDNAILRNYDSPEFNSRGFLKAKPIQKRTEEYVREFQIKNAGLKKPVKFMSGGNLQKLLFAREVSGDPKVIVAAYPVHGLDVGATNAIHDILLRERSRGCAIILISEDLEELFKLSDHVAVLFEGEVTGIVAAKDFSYDGVGSLMVGIVPEESVISESVSAGKSAIEGVKA